MPIENLKGLFSGGKDVTDVEPSEPNLDKKLTLKYAERHRGSIRLSLAKYYTKKEWDEKRKKLKGLSLP